MRPVCSKIYCHRPVELPRSWGSGLKDWKIRIISHRATEKEMLLRWPLASRNLISKFSGWCPDQAWFDNMSPLRTRRCWWPDCGDWKISVNDWCRSNMLILYQSPLILEIRVRKPSGKTRRTTTKKKVTHGIYIKDPQKNKTIHSLE